MKKTEDGKRISDDRHHALDAFICAATTQSQLQKLTKAFQEAEAKGSRRNFSKLDPPWPSFVEETKQALAEVFVSRAEKRRARGEGHAATIRSIGELDGKQVVYERKPVDRVTLKDLENIKDAERNRRIVEALRSWIESEKPKDAMPAHRVGGKNKDGIEKEPERFVPIRKVAIASKKKVDVLVREGAAERGEMVRVDAFRKKSKGSNWEFYFVPIYPHQVADIKTWPNPPNHAVAQAKDKSEWFEMNSEYEFIWSLHPFSFVEFEKADGTFMDGYFVE